MNDRDHKRERRRQQRLERLGSNAPCCVICDEADPCCLEHHHIAGRAFGDAAVIVCWNHHRKLSDKQKEHPPAISAKPTALECTGHVLLGIGDVLALLDVTPAIVELVGQIGGDLIEYAGTQP